MLRKFLSIFTTSVFLIATTAPAMAAERDLFPSTRNHTHDQFSRNSGITAGAYVRVPFNGGLKRASEEPRFGLRLTGNLAGQYRYQNTFLGAGSQRLLDLSLGTSGSDSFRVNSLTIDQFNALYAAGADEEGKKGMHPAVIGLAVVGGVILVLLAVFAVECATNDEDEFTIC
jgi:hypothetical protein